MELNDVYCFVFNIMDQVIIFLIREESIELLGLWKKHNIVEGK
jgi:hypothetical protein